MKDNDPDPGPDNPDSKTDPPANPPNSPQAAPPTVPATTLAAAPQNEASAAVRPSIRVESRPVWILSDGTDDPPVYLSESSAWFGLAVQLIRAKYPRWCRDWPKLARRAAKLLRRWAEVRK